MIKMILSQIRGKLVDGLLMAACALLSYHLLFASNGVRLYLQLNALEAYQQAKLSALKSEQSQLRHKQHLLQNDASFLDQEVRVVWEMVKPDEKIFWYTNMEEL